ncbi:54S ribosomal protein L49, mitochondrial [Golovinomyces cichoracearum]|uniref:Large ribosomal subunit protein bL21m n=1 Tax=Golovinomyces cichoracearum TaxID=62708 RepID=A0A420J472_9PEZI|nr:54S ribosomal protein L49, mitochondrial [Golovinomyces cichoracearum]
MFAHNLGRSKLYVRLGLWKYSLNSVTTECNRNLNLRALHNQSSTSSTPELLSSSSVPPFNQKNQNPPLQHSERPKVSESVKQLLPLLAIQPSHYIIIHIHAKPYLVMAGDIVRLPFKMPGVVPGDILRLNRAACIGSRDYTLKGTPYIDEQLYECRATVMGTESEPMRFKKKTKRRCRKVKTVKSKHRFTILRIAELKIKSLEDVKPL